MNQLSLFSEKTLVKALPFQYAESALEGFQKGGRIVGLTKGQFSLIDMINAMLKKIGPCDISISTWSAGLRDSKSLEEMMNSGRVKSLRIITDRSFVSRQKEYAISITNAFGADNIRTTNTHAKFVILKNEEYNIVIRSSMNLNENKRCENYDLDDNVEIYNFFQGVVDEVFEQMPQGFIESRSKVDPVFDALTFDGQSVPKVRNKSKINTGSFGDRSFAF